MKKFLLASAFAFCATAMVAEPAPAPVFAADFETPTLAEGYGYWVYGAIPDWTVSAGKSVRIHHARGGKQAAKGFQFVELDGIGNARISHDMTLEPGAYELRFRYRAEYWESKDPKSFGVLVCLEGADGGPCRSFVGGAREDRIWREKAVAFSVDSAGTYSLSFEALGTADGVGAHIDAVELVRK